MNDEKFEKLIRGMWLFCMAFLLVSLFLAVMLFGFGIAFLVL